MVLYIVLLLTRRCAALGRWLRRGVQLSVVIAAACAGLAAVAGPASAGTGPSGGSFGFTNTPPPGVAAPGSPAAPSLAASQRQLFVPDLIAAMPSGITSSQLAAISKLRGVQAVLPVDGGKVTVNGQSVNLLGVSPQAFRSWTPLSTAGSAAIWSNLGKGQLISTTGAARRLHLTAGKSYPVSAALPARLPFGGATALSVTGADAVVNLSRAAQLGLAPNFAVLISAPPSASLPTLMARVKSVIGKRGQVVNLVSYSLVTASQKPVATIVPAGAPANYLNLFKASAAKYCPGMSWTVLAAIGQIESGDGANNGPSSAGALGPMQFMPATWAEWGINGFGSPGPPDINNPLDAVPSAARMLCAAGAGNPATLSRAIFAYNHATWYVAEVLALASEYAKNSG
ncbi:MAG TPA: lytic transglycosylase domain-containing protein [Streptosporangiaceae bacterium]|nr:lytic transglycosylase domain-containing protein [Streptosporangiaceae bacterium]